MRVILMAGLPMLRLHPIWDRAGPGSPRRRGRTRDRFRRCAPDSMIKPRAPRQDGKFRECRCAISIGPLYRSGRGVLPDETLAFQMDEGRRRTGHVKANSISARCISPGRRRGAIIDQGGPGCSKRRPRETRTPTCFSRISPPAVKGVAGIESGCAGR